MTKLVVAGACAACTAILFAAAPASAQNGTTKLPVDDYLNVVPAGALQAWWDPQTGEEIVVDVYGKRGLNPDTSVDGQVTISKAKKGTEKVVLHLHTKNALCYGFNAYTGDKKFGYNTSEIAAGAEANFGDMMMRAEWTKPEGAPLVYTVGWDRVETTIMCDGVLRAGSGYPEGTPGFAQTTQTGLRLNGSPDNCPPEKDANCFPAEKVQFKATGQ